MTATGILSAGTTDNRLSQIALLTALDSSAVRRFCDTHHSKVELIVKDSGRILIGFSFSVSGKSSRPSAI